MAVNGSRSCPVRVQTGADAREQFTLRGAETVDRVRALIREGNVLRIWIKGADGKTLIEIPSLLGIRSGDRLPPVLAAVGALASASGDLTLEVQREAGWPPYA